MKRVFEINEDEVELPRFTLDGEINRQYKRFNAVGTTYSAPLNSMRDRIRTQCPIS
jgi:hypothetical protein